MTTWRMGRTAALAALLLTACTPVVSQNEAGTDARPVRGGSLTVAQNADAQPGAVLAARAGNGPWVMNVFETLVRLDPANREPKPLLATSWKLSPDAKQMDIDLRDDVTFHTGRKMTADDVKFSIEAAADPKNASQVGFIARTFTSIAVDSPTKLTITANAPLTTVFDLFEQTVILDRDTFSGLADGSKVIGTGPYRFASWQPGASIKLERYDGYRDKNVALLDSVEFAVITDATAQLSALRSNRAGIVTGLSNSDARTFEGNNQYQVVKTSGTIYPLGVNTSVPPFDNRSVRQAIGYAVDRERINQQVFGGQGTVTDLFWSPQEPGYPKDLATQYTYDPAKAKKMIADAGAAGTTISVVVPAIPAVQSEFEIVQNNLTEAGFVVKAEVLNVTDFDARQVQGNLGNAFLLLHGQVGLGSTTLINSLPSLRQGNPSKFWTDEYVKLRNDLAAAPADQRGPALVALSRYLTDEAFCLTIVQAPGPQVISGRVHDVKFTARGALLLASAYVTT